MTFDVFKSKLIRLARRAKISHLVPGNNVLFGYWEREASPEQVISLLSQEVKFPVRATPWHGLGVQTGSASVQPLTGQLISGLEIAKDVSGLKE